MKRGPNPFAENSAKCQKTSDNEEYINWLLDPNSLIEKNDTTVSFDEVFNSIDQTIAYSTDPLPLPAQNAAPTHTIEQLITAIRTKTKRNVQDILQNPANHSLVNMTNNKLITPLMVALQINSIGHNQILGLLLKCGANPMLPSQVYKDNITIPMSPIDYVLEILARAETTLARRQGYEKNLMLLKTSFMCTPDNDISMDDMKTFNLDPLPLSAQNAVPTHTIAQLMAAIRTKITHNVKYILQNPVNYSLTNMTDQNGKTPLMVALQINRNSGHHEIVRLLLECGANPMLPSQVHKDNITIPMSPISYVREILAHSETTITPRQGHEKNLTLLETLSFKNHLDNFNNSTTSLDKVSAHETVSPTMVPLTQKGEPTHTIEKFMAVIRLKNTMMVKSILQNPANHPLINMIDKGGKTPLMVALQICQGKGLSSILQLLLDAGADPMIPCQVQKDNIKIPMSPYHYVKEIIARPGSTVQAVYKKHLQRFKKQETLGNKKTQEVYTPNAFIVAIERKPTNQIISILKNPENHRLVNKANHKGKTPLMAALLMQKGIGQYDKLKLLLKNGADPSMLSAVANDGMPISPIDYVQEILTRPETPLNRHRTYTKYQKEFLNFQAHLTTKDVEENSLFAEEIPSEASLLDFFADENLNPLLLNFKTIDEKEPQPTSVDWLSPTPTLNWKNTSGHNIYTQNIDTQIDENEEVPSQELFQSSTNFKHNQR